MFSLNSKTADILSKTVFGGKMGQRNTYVHILKSNLATTQNKHTVKNADIYAL